LFFLFVGPRNNWTITELSWPVVSSFPSSTHQPSFFKGEKIEKAVDDPETQKCPAAGPLRKMGGTARGSGVSAESSV
jgi:hypothetical protein